jgi:arginase
MKTIEIFGFPIDLGASRRGVDMGPSAIRLSGLQKQLEDLGYNVFDRGDINIKTKEVLHITNPKLKYLDEIVKASNKLGAQVEKSLNNGNFPLCIGGDHSIALGSIAGIASHCKKHNKKLGIIWVDAHADMNTDSTTPSGNIHGMGFSASLGLGNDALSGIMNIKPKAESQNCALIGVRSIDSKERENMNSLGIQVFTMHEIDKMGIYKIICKVIEDLKSKVDHIHLSFDVDAIDPETAPGVGTPVKGGLSYRETHLMMEVIAESGCLSSMEIAEVNPILDSGNRTAELVSMMIASSLGLKIY